MSSANNREIARRFASQYGLMTRDQLRGVGVSAAYIRSRVATGEWQLFSAKVVRLAAVPSSPEHDLTGLLLAVGPDSVATHRSAAWIWRMSGAPSRPEVSAGRRGFRKGAPGIVHRPRQWPARVVMHRGFPCTDPPAYHR